MARVLRAVEWSFKCVMSVYIWCEAGEWVAKSVSCDILDNRGQCHVTALTTAGSVM